MFKLLSTSNTKIIKGEGRGYKSYILHLAPADESGHEVCPKRTAGCTKGCLNKSGHGGMFKPGETSNPVQRARIRRTKYFFANRDAFMVDLAQDIRKAIKSAKKKGLTPVFRLNGTSDLSWEKYWVPVYDMTLFELFSDVQFYDYTKVLGRKIDNFPNYHLTFSRAESNDADVRKALLAGLNVAQVYDTIPEGVYSADEDDLRFLDPAVGIIGLKAKGPAKKDYTGFVIRIKSVDN
jgi:hypothetical protein